MHRERHRIAHVGWLRAAVIGANDGPLSTASLVVGAAASGTPRSAVLLADVAGIVAGSMSMAAGEYVSVSAQARRSPSSSWRRTHWGLTRETLRVTLWGALAMAASAVVGGVFGARV
jgi:VIT1/CCC1 family predicted Fe2+/Mn2+ transporter